MCYLLLRRSSVRGSSRFLLERLWSTYWTTCTICSALHFRIHSFHLWLPALSHAFRPLAPPRLASRVVVTGPIPIPISVRVVDCLVFAIGPLFLFERALHSFTLHSFVLPVACCLLSLCQLQCSSGRQSPDDADSRNRLGQHGLG